MKTIFASFRFSFFFFFPFGRVDKKLKDEDESISFLMAKKRRHLGRTGSVWFGGIRSRVVLAASRRLIFFHGTTDCSITRSST